MSNDNNNIAAIDDGGPAFPCATDEVLVDPKGNRVHIVMRGGMSLRRWYAGQALIGVMVRHWPGEGSSFEPLSLNKPDHIVSVASDCLKLADALIAAEKSAIASLQPASQQEPASC